MKFLILLCAAVAGAFAAPTSVAIAFNPAQLAQPVAIRAAVTPAGGGLAFFGGTVIFTSDGTPIAGCAAVALQDVEIGYPVAICHTAFPRLGTHTIVAAYQGFGQWEPGSASATLEVGKVSAGVYIALTPPTGVYGGPLTAGALLLGAPGVAVPSGAVSFLEGATALGAATVDAEGHSRIPLTLGAGSHTILGRYEGDANYQAANAVGAAVTIARSPATVAVSATPAQIDQPVTITASVLPVSAAGGTVTITPLAECSGVPVQNGFATCRTTFARLGEVALTASYSGDANTLPGSASVRLNVGKAVAGIYLAFTPAAPVYGQTVELSVLALGAAGVAPPTGSIIFSDGATVLASRLLDSGGRASLAAAFSVGAHAIRAVYNGDGNYGSSQAAATLVVVKAGTVTTLTANTGGPFTAVVTPAEPGSGAPTGTVRFLRDRQPIATVALVPMGSASSATIATSGQTGSLSAEYLGDANFAGSVSVSTTVDTPGVQVTLASDRNPTAAGQAVTFTATVTPNPGNGTPLGSVQFTADGAALGTVALSAGHATLVVTLPAGAHRIAANYSGDASYPAGSASLTQTITGGAATLKLTSSASSPVFGESVTFTAQLAPAAVGTVQFSDGGTALGFAALVSGVANLTVSALAAGTHTIGAAWTGNDVTGAASAQVVQPVGKARTATGLALVGGVAVATVSVMAPGAGSPPGSVRFVDAVTNTVLATAPLTGGSASSALPQAVNPVVAVYSGDANFLASISQWASALAAANAASYETGSFAPDEIVTLFGPNLAAATAATVRDSAGTIREASLLYAAPQQAALVLPHDLAAGPALLSVAGLSTSIAVARSSPGLFTADSSGKGTPVGQALHLRADGSTESGALDSIEWGGTGDSVYLVLYGTGFRHFTEQPACTIGGQSAEVVFAGAQPGFPGLDQVNVRLPDSLRGAGSVRLVLTVDGVAGNAVTLVLP